MVTCGMGQAWGARVREGGAQRRRRSALWSGHGAGSTRVSPRPSQSTFRAAPRADRLVADGASGNLGSSVSMKKLEKLPGHHSGHIFRTVFLQALSDQESCWKSLWRPASRCRSSVFLCVRPRRPWGLVSRSVLRGRGSRAWGLAVDSGVSLGEGSAGAKFKWHLPFPWDVERMDAEPHAEFGGGADPASTQP